MEKLDCQSRFKEFILVVNVSRYELEIQFISFYGDLLTSKTHHYNYDSMNSLNSMKELWKNSTVRVVLKSSY